jgi:hypothetical protein
VMKNLSVAATFLAVALTTVLGCSGGADTAQSRSKSQSAETLSGQAKRSCPVTSPNGKHPTKNAGFNHGNGSLWVALAARKARCRDVSGWLVPGGNQVRRLYRREARLVAWRRRRV